MNKIEFLDTASLERLHREFENPQTLTESIMRRGIVAELETRWGGLKPPITAREEEQDEEIARLEDDAIDLNQKLEDAGSEVESKDEEIARLKSENSDLDKRVKDALHPVPKAA